MRVIYNYITETNNVSRLYNVAAILWLQFMAHVIIFCALLHQYFPQSSCSVKYGCCLYSFASCFPGKLVG